MDFLEIECIIRDKVVSVVYAKGLDAPACTIQEGNQFIIVINESELKEIKDPALRIVIEKALRLHEAAHVQYDTFPKFSEAIKLREGEVNQTVYKCILNVLEDVRIEECVAKEYGSLAKYLSFLLSHIEQLNINGEKVRYEDDAIGRVIKKIEEENGQLIKTLVALFYAVRFGQVQKKYITEDTIEDLSFIVPRVFLSRRGQVCDVIQATNEIYDYLDKKYKIPPEIEITLVYVVSDNVVKELMKIEDKDEKDSISVIPWKTRKVTIRSAKEAIEEGRREIERRKKELIQGGLIGGHDHATLEPPTIRDISFYISAVEKYRETINSLIKIFKNLRGKRWFVPAYDGELNLSPRTLQGAYVDSFKVQDEEKYYRQMRTILPDADVGIVEDQSGSTYDTAELFASSVICFLEAVRHVKKIRSAVVGFGDGIRILKDFNERVEQGRHYPFFSGGTPLAEAIEEILKLNWRNNVQKVIILLTDGYPDDWKKVDESIKKVKELKMKTVAMCVGIEANDDYRARFEKVYEIKNIEELPMAIFQAFVENALIKQWSN